MYVRCDESSLYSRINYKLGPDGNFQECPGIIKTMATGAGTRIAHYANAPVLTRKKLDVMI